MVISFNGKILIYFAVHILHKYCWIRIRNYIVWYPIVVCHILRCISWWQRPVATDSISKSTKRVAYQIQYDTFRQTVTGILGSYFNSNFEWRWARPRYFTNPLWLRICQSNSPCYPPVKVTRIQLLQWYSLTYPLFLAFQLVLWLEAALAGWWLLPSSSVPSCVATKRNICHTTLWHKLLSET